MVIEFEGAWRVTVVRDGSPPQTFHCHDERTAQRWATLFERPLRPAPAPRVPLAATPTLFDRVVPKVLEATSRWVAAARRAVRSSERRHAGVRPTVPGQGMRFVVPEIAGYSTL